MTSPTLTAEAEAFARAYVRTGNASAAYRDAFKPGPISKRALWKRARTELDRPEVAAAVEALRAQHTAPTETTVPAAARDFIEALERMRPSTPGTHRTTSAAHTTRTARGSIVVDDFVAALSPRR